jgi:glyoxylase-like metal-dependent hydrolase (beta-lactamase superfamily II)
MAGLKPLQLRVGTMANFVYVLVDEEGREALIVDSGWEIEPILRSVKESRSTVKFCKPTRFLSTWAGALRFHKCRGFTTSHFSPTHR